MIAWRDQSLNVQVRLVQEQVPPAAATAKQNQGEGARGAADQRGRYVTLQNTKPLALVSQPTYFVCGILTYNMSYRWLS
jgi:hypothetical protein